MEWQIAITRNRQMLLNIIVALMKTLGLVRGQTLTTLPRTLYRNALAIIRPAEATVRRLIMIAAYDMELRDVLPRTAQPRTTHNAAPFPSTTNFAPSFCLIDPLKTFAPDAPDYSCFGPALDLQRTPYDATPVSAASLGRRLLALQNALTSIQKQARRLNRWYAVRDLTLKQKQPHRLSPLRPGFPPGYRARPVHPVEEVLLDCHSLAQHARARRDSS